MKRFWAGMRDWALAVRRLPRRMETYRENMRADEKWRGEFNGWAVRFGYSGRDYMESAIAIAKRLDGTEDALRRVAQSLEAEAAVAGLPGLTAAEIERLAVLAEECGEVAQAVGKVLRNGYQGTSPFGGPTNRVSLEHEIGDVCAAIQMMQTAGDVRAGDVKHWQWKKAVGIHKWLHHQGVVKP